MKKLLIIGFCLSVSFITAGAARAATLGIDGLNSLVYGTTQYAGEYVGPLGASLQGATITGGITCLDINTSTNVPNAFEVYVGSLAPVDLSHAKFASNPYTAAQLFHYQEAAALLGQMPTHTDQIGAIQFAIWRIFDPTHAPGANPALEDYWMNWAANIKVTDYNFSSVGIYTPTNTRNQEFMSGATTLAPIPGAWLLLGSGLLALVGFRKIPLAL